MATTLFLRALTESGVTIGSNEQRQFSTTRGSSVTSFTTNLVASGNHLVLARTDASPTQIWLYQVNAVTISGTITVGFWGHEFAMTNNAQMAAIISRYDSGGTFISDVLAQANANHARGTELGTVGAAQSWTATPTSTTFADGDWLALIVHADAIGTMEGSLNAFVFDFDGATSGAFGDSFLTFTETITQFIAAAANPPYVNPMPQLLAQ